MNARRRQFVFGYGSLTARPGPGPGLTRELKEHGFIADATGLRRSWGVAMDNRRDLPGYKYYTDASGRRPEVFVVYLDLIVAADGDGAAVNGVCFPVDDAALEVLDARERNYERVDVSDRVAPAGLGGVRIWAYLGSAAARERFAAGRQAGTAVIDAGYVRTVQAGFAALGPAEHAACRPSLEPNGMPVVELRRHELP